MVVHEGSDNIQTVNLDAKMTNKESKKFLIVNNHVREIPIKYKSNSTSSDNEKYAEESTPKNRRQKMNRKRKRSLSKNKTSRDEMETSDLHENTIINESDLEDLRTVYKKCKAVIKKIETKYGHLLDLNLPTSSKQRVVSDQETECTCETNKRIVFDDDGKEISVDATTKIHICPKKSTQVDNHQNIKIEYTENDAQLPDSLQELHELLKNPSIRNTLRHSIIYKMKCIKAEISNEIKFNKHSLIEKLKSNPDELLGFEGTNLASISGYQ